MKRRLLKIAPGAFVLGMIAAGFYVLGQVSITGTLASDAAGLGGRLFFHSDSPFVGQDTGAAVKYWSGMYPVTVPPAFGTWTQVNFGTSTVNQNTGGIYINPALSASTNLRILALAILTPPYTLTARIRFACNKSGGGHTGIGWRQSTSGKLVMMSLGADGSGPGTFYGFNKWNSATSFSANYTAAYFSGGGQNVQYFRITDSGGNFTVFYSFDGFNWQQLGTAQSRTDFLTVSGPDQYIFECDTNDGTYGAQCTLESLVQS